MAARPEEHGSIYPVLDADLGESTMMNPLHTQPGASSDPNAPDTAANPPQARKVGFADWLRQRFGAEPPHRHSENFFISDVTEGGIGSHHRQQVFRQEKRH